MRKRNKIIIIAVAVFLVILIIFLIVWSLGRKEKIIETIETEQPQETDQVRTISGTNQSLPVEEPMPTVTREPQTQTMVLAIASTAAEKFGTFSNESGFENIKEMQSIMTKEMQEWSKNYMEENVAENQSFYGITTKALNAQIINLNDEETNASVLVSVQRAEIVGQATGPRVFYQKILVGLVKLGNSWLVNNLEWR